MQIVTSEFGTQQMASGGCSNRARYIEYYCGGLLFMGVFEVKQCLKQITEFFLSLEYCSDSLRLTVYRFNSR